MTKNSVKYNEACIKLFEFLKMLYHENPEFKKVLDHFSDGNYDGKTNTHVTLNKYLNTMKIFGINVKKLEGKYFLQNSLTQISLDIEDLKSLKLLKETTKLLPESANKENLQKFLRDLEIRFDKQTKEKINSIKSLNKINLYNNSKLIEQIKECEKYCFDKLKLEILFNDENNNQLNLLCSPIERTYNKKEVCMKVLGNNGSRIYEIPFNSIISIKQLPISCSSTSIPTTVVYRIKNRLAKNYKLRDWERLDKIESDNSKIIINKDEDLNLLIKRLMKYGVNCEIISPKFLKNEMINQIDNTLKNYE